MALSIGDHIRSYRMRRGLTQEQLAHLIGRSERWLIDVERGEVDPRLSDAVALARALSIGVADLTTDHEPKARPPPVQAITPLARSSSTSSPRASKMASVSAPRRGAG
jgi:DNA-binding XRE family transcriptional regulator